MRKSVNSIMKRGIMWFSGIWPVKVSLINKVRKLTKEQIKDKLNYIEKLGEKEGK